MDEFGSVEPTPGVDWKANLWTWTSLGTPPRHRSKADRKPRASLSLKKKVLKYDKRKVFMLGEEWDPEEKEVIAAAVRNLGGEFLDKTDWDSSCTHVIAKNFSLTPVVRKALDNDKFIVTKNFAIKSESMGEWDKEDGYIMDIPTDLAEEHTKEKVFLLAGGWIAGEKNNIIQKILALGARVLDSDKWVDECTHVIVSSFIMSEKIMAAVAAGRWVLDRDFVEKSYQVGLWQEESLHVSNEVVLNNKIAWARLGEKGACFAGMKAVFLMEDHEEQIKNVYTRIIRAGGGQVLEDVDLDVLVSSVPDTNGPAMSMKVEVCEVCAGIFVSPASLSRHMKTNHPRKRKNESNVGTCCNLKKKRGQKRKVAKHNKCNCEIEPKKLENIPENWSVPYIRKITSRNPKVETPDLTHIFVDPSVLVRNNPRYRSFQKWFRFAQSKLNVHHLYYKFISQKIKDKDELIHPEDWSILVWKPCYTTVRVQKFEN